jgi:hypothetical protein
MKYLMATLLLAVVVAPVGRATDYTSAATVSATFQCPEQLPSDQARAAELKGYIDWMLGQHPDWSMPKITGTRLYLLEIHHCDKTLAAIQATKSIH